MHLFTQQDVRLKNADSWTSLASLSQSSSSQMARKEPAAANSFAQFRKQAKEKEERVRLCACEYGCVGG